MTSVPLGRGAYKRAAAGEAEVRCENRYFEVNPENPGGVALLARPGTTELATFGSGPIRRCFTKTGLFNDDLFVVSGSTLYRYDGTSTTAITGTVEGSGAPNFAWMKGIGYERLFIADGLLLQYYEGGSQATGTLTSDSYDYSWTGRTSAEDNSWRSVCWSDDLTLFCAVASDGTHRVMTSPDGVTWTARTAASAIYWTQVIWVPELALFVAVGANETADGVMTSPDGTTWTTRVTDGSNRDWYGVAWSPELALLCAVAGDGSVMTSDDGVTWTLRTAAAANSWRGVAWSSDLSLFCAVAATGSGNGVMTSPDGINWTSQAPALDVQWNSVVWASELTLFCAIGSDFMTSPDGVTWTKRAKPAGNFGHAVCWSSDLRLFAAVGPDGIVTSPDGVVWTERTAASANDWRGVCWSPDLFMFAAVAITGTGTRVMTSDANSTPVIIGQIIEIGGEYYSWNSDVDAGAPDGTQFNPWLAKLAADDRESLANMAKLLNYAGTPGTDFSAAITGPNELVTAEASAFTLTLTAISHAADGNAITTTLFVGSDLTWSGATLSGGNTHTLVAIDVPDGQKALALASVSSFVLVSIANSQKCYFIRPGEVTIDGADFFEKESNPDNILDMVTVGDLVFIGGDGSVESWYATGATDPTASLFAPQEGRVPMCGVITGTPVLVDKTTVITVGDDGKVYAFGDSVERISDHGIEERVRRWLRAQEGLTP